MIIKSLKLINWRNYDEASFNFDSGVNVIVGSNAAGKTNVLEALVMLAITKSFRTKKDRALVRRGEGFAKVIGEFVNEDGDQTEEVRIVVADERRIKKSLRLAGVEKKVLEVMGNLRVVYFSPEEIERFFGSPAMRRRWMDVALSLTDSQYAYRAAMYKKVVQNRNQVLKRIAEGRGKGEELNVWDEKLIEFAVPIIAARRQLIDLVSVKIKDYFGQLFVGDGELKMSYKQATTDSDVERGLREELERYYNNEVRNGNTVVGPHREDVIISLDGVDITEWGSRAQMRLSLLSLKLAELDFIKQARGEVVLLLDDIFSELDESNKNQVFDFIGRQQTVITATDLEGIENIKGNIIDLA